jgi:uncharacterized protein YbaR (Trm112 family)
MNSDLFKQTELLTLLQCPNCKYGTLTAKGVELVCSGCTLSFPLAGHRPILLRNDNALFSIGDYRKAVPDQMTGPNGWARFVPSPSVNLASDRVLNKLRAMLDANGICNILVVGGGRQRAWLDPLLRAAKPHRVVYSDIDSGADVDLFCDAHDLPFVDSAFDAVVTTAVLEHVLYPERVAAEIARVLKTGGLLYSELPFMQQVHEGAYDFTRFTLSGHRRLFNQFAEIDAGMVAGPATAFVWALENLTLAFASRPILRKLAKVGVRLGFGWIKYLDHFLANRPEAMDGASCTYFMGAKAEERTPDSDIIARYIGAKTLRHV